MEQNLDRTHTYRVWLVLTVVAVIVFSIWPLHLLRVSKGVENTEQNSPVEDAAYRSALSSFAATGDSDVAVRNIHELKAIIQMANVPAEEKAMSITRLARWYSISGYSGFIFNEIFSGPLYNEYKVEGDTMVTWRKSINKLLLWSLETYPYSITATSLAKNHLAGALLTSSSTIRYERIDDAEKYLKLAIDWEIPNSISSTIMTMTAHADYLYDRAYIIGQLAALERDPYGDEYRAAYEELIDYIQVHPELNNSSNLALSHWRYASLLLQLEGDVSEARVHLKNASELASLGSPFTKNSVIFSVMQLLQSGDEDNVALVKKMEEISPPFKIFVDTEVR